MPQQTNCPDQKWFSRLVTGKLTSEQETKLSRHLDQCEECQERLEQLNRSSLLSEAKNTSVDAMTGDSSLSSRPVELESKLAEIRASRPSAASAFNSGYADVLPWLEEAKPNIGRIAEFELTRLIGRGGMGIVFEAHDTKLERAVAIKLMSPSMLAESSASERFLREARSAAKINHANIVTVHAVGETNGLPSLFDRPMAR